VGSIVITKQTISPSSYYLIMGDRIPLFSIQWVEIFGLRIVIKKFSLLCKFFPPWCSPPPAKLQKVSMFQCEFRIELHKCFNVRSIVITKQATSSSSYYLIMSNRIPLFSVQWVEFLGFCKLIKKLPLSSRRFPKVFFSKSFLFATKVQDRVPTVPLQKIESFLFSIQVQDRVL